MNNIKGLRKAKHKRKRENTHVSENTKCIGKQNNWKQNERKTKDEGKNGESLTSVQET